MTERAWSTWLARLTLGWVVLLSGCSSYMRHVEKGDQLMQQRLYSTAQQEYEQAIRMDPTRAEARAKLRILQTQWSEEFVQHGDSKRKRKDFEAAVVAYQKALQVNSDNADAPGRLKATREEWIAAARAILAQGQLDLALTHFDSILRLFPKNPEAYAGREETRFGLARRQFEIAENYERQGKLGNAMVEFVKADQIRTGATPARERAEAVRRKLVDTISFLVVASPVVDRTHSPDIAQRMQAGRLGTMALGKLPLKVVTQAPKNAEGVRLSVSLDRVAYSKDHQITQKMQKYVAGMRSVVNPKRSEAEKALLDVERQLEDVQQDVSSAVRAFSESFQDLERSRTLFERCRNLAMLECQKRIQECHRATLGAAEGTVPHECAPGGCSADGCSSDEQQVSARKTEVNNARTRLEAFLAQKARQDKDVQRMRDVVFREPLTVEEPMHADFVYDVEVHQATVRASVTLQIDDLNNNNAPPAPFSQDYVVNHEDLAHRGYDRYGILADPVQLKSEMELRVLVGDQALADIYQRIRTRFNAYRQVLLADARRSLVRAGADDAVETSVRAILASAEEPPADLLTALSRARQVQNPNALLGFEPPRKEAQNDK